MPEPALVVCPGRCGGRDGPAAALCRGRGRASRGRLVAGGQDQPAPGARYLAVTGLVRVLPAQAVIKRQRRGVAGGHLEGCRGLVSGEPGGQQGPPHSLPMPVGHHVEVMHETVQAPDGDKSAGGTALLRYPDLLPPGLLGKILQPKQGGLDPMEGLPPPLEEQLRQHGFICLSHLSDHEDILDLPAHCLPLSMDPVAVSNRQAGPS